MLHEEMWKLSKRPLRLKGNQLVYHYIIIIGYFSGSYANNNRYRNDKKCFDQNIKKTFNSNLKLLLLLLLG